MIKLESSPQYVTLPLTDPNEEWENKGPAKAFNCAFFQKGLYTMKKIYVCIYIHIIYIYRYKIGIIYVHIQTYITYIKGNDRSKLLDAI